MPRMRKILIIILTFAPLILLGQNVTCCASEKDVEAYLNGKWKESNSDSNAEFIYNFENGISKIKYVQPSDIDAIAIEDHEQDIEIIKHENGFKIKYIDKNSDVIYSLISKLKYLNSNTLILVTDGKETEYYKTTE